MERKCMLTSILISQLLAYLVTFLGLLILAFLLFKLQMGTDGIELGVMAVYILSTAAGGFFLGRKMEIRRFMWGLLAGFLYVIILVGVSVLTKGDASGLAHHGVATLLLCLTGGTFGGMLS